MSNNKLPSDAINKMPQKGYVLAYFKTKTVFEPYEIRDGHPVFKGSQILEEELPAECHFFDKEREYRICKRESRGDVLEFVFTSQEEHDMNPDLIYANKQIVKEEYTSKADVPEVLLIINRYRFGEQDTLVLDNYRISFL